MNSTDDFDVLLAQVRAGDEGALTRLIEQHASVVHRAARRMLSLAMRAQVDTLDVMQSVYCTLLMGLRDGKFDISSPDKLSALVLTLLRRKLARAWRHIKRQPERGGGDLSVMEGGMPGDGEPDPAQIAQFNDEVSHLLARLDDIDRRLLHLRLQGYSTADVAREMGLDSGFLRVRLGRLRQLLREEGFEDTRL
jgi:RNA polymerase sigma-70 factor (ECF subfamily)